MTHAELEAEYRKALTEVRRSLDQNVQKLADGYEAAVQRHGRSTTQANEAARVLQVFVDGTREAYGYAYRAMNLPEVGGDE